MNAADATHVEQRREAALRTLNNTADEMDLMDYMVSFVAGQTGLANPRQFPRGVDLHLPSAGLQSLLHRWANDVHTAHNVLDGDDA